MMVGESSAKINLDVSAMAMTDIPSPLDTRTWIMRTTGIAAEDAERIIQRVSEEAIAYYIANRPAPEVEAPPERKPIEVDIRLSFDYDRVVAAIKGEIDGAAW